MELREEPGEFLGACTPERQLSHTRRIHNPAPTRERHQLQVRRCVTPLANRSRSDSAHAEAQARLKRVKQTGLADPGLPYEDGHPIFEDRASFIDTPPIFGTRQDNAVPQPTVEQLC